jgi:hypothetical protein
MKTWFDWLVVFTPVIAQMLGKAIPQNSMIISFVTPFLVLAIVYFATVGLSKYRCKKQNTKETFSKSLAPVSFYVALTVVIYVSMVVKIAPVVIIGNICTNPLVWFVFGFAYWGVFNKVFEKDKC